MTKITRQYIIENAKLILPYEDSEELLVIYTDDNKKIIFDINTTEVIKEDVYSNIEYERVYPNGRNIQYAIKDKKPLGLVSYNYYDRKHNREITTSYVPRNVNKKIYAINLVRSI